MTRRNALKAKGLRKTTRDRFLPNLPYPRLIATEILATRDLFVPGLYGVRRVVIGDVRVISPALCLLGDPDLPVLRRGMDSRDV